MKETIEKTMVVRGNLKLSGVPRYGNAVDTEMKYVAGLVGAGVETPDLFVDTHHGEGIGAQVGDTYVTTTPDMQSPYIDANGLIFSADTPTMRDRATRGRTAWAGVEQVTMTADHRIVVEAFSDRLMAKMDIVSDQEVIFVFTDLQVGSTTMRPDLLVKQIVKFIHEVLPNHKVHLRFNGDMIQGRNYPEMPNENPHIGLIKIDHQKSYLSSVFKAAFAQATPEQLKNIVDVRIVPGNHEWNSRHKDTGESYTGFVKDMMTEIFLEKGVTPPPIQVCDTVDTGHGDYFRSWSDVAEVAGYGVLGKHLILERGMKGDGSIPIYNWHTQFLGTRELSTKIDIGYMGDKHNPEWGLFINGKFVMIMGALAGLSGFEYDRAYRAIKATGLIRLGGNKPPAYEIWSERTLSNYIIPDGYFSEKNLKKDGLKADETFDRLRHGWANRTGPQDELGTKLWQMRDTVIFDRQSTI